MAIDKVSLFLYYKGNIQSEGLLFCQKDLGKYRHNKIHIYLKF